MHEASVEPEREWWQWMSKSGLESNLRWLQEKAERELPTLPKERREEMIQIVQTALATSDHR